MGRSQVHTENGAGGSGADTDSSSMGGSAGVKQLEKPFILSEGLPPVPYKLASKILRGEYIDMAKLLRDNLEAQRRAATTEVATPHPASTPKNRREVPDILSWVQCFGVYMAVVTSTFPERTKELLAYQTLIVREARRRQTGLSLTSHSTQSPLWPKANEINVQAAFCVSRATIQRSSVLSTHPHIRLQNMLVWGEERKATSRRLNLDSLHLTEQDQ